MKIYNNLSEFIAPQYAVVTSGTFDGVHQGHQKILKRIRKIADQHNGETVLITYWPHPRHVLFPEDNSLQLLSSIEEKAELLSQNGIDHLIRLPFTQEFAQMAPEDFVQNILINAIGTKKLVIGYDHHFGKNRSGNFEFLKQNQDRFGFELEEISRHDVDEVGVSSSKIRNHLLRGTLKEANQYLSRPYELSGQVVHGQKLGRTIQFPTANIEVAFKHKLIPKFGVYAVLVEFEGALMEGMLNIGKNPTVSATEDVKMEVHIFDFDKDLYQQCVRVIFIDRLREEKKFESVAALKSALEEDKNAAKTILKNYRR
ncbi:bifunctional riboflavin kinase/FAD synthetase [Persicobacter psychrovividus]|uniref:Riboflavin biosynthesis protein n=1 Tax=Persicobacter psychrovividus TaxID=387638 RepID=A0ABN6L7V5_9BACT|nr:riboflavin biosynthesis protein [Persicobacter psychrovividus]